MKFLLIDADSLIYRAALSSEYVLHTLSKDGDVEDVKGVRKLKQYLKGGWTLVESTEVLEPLHFAKSKVKDMISALVGSVEPQGVEVYLTVPNTKTHRHKLYPMYKANRKAPKPKHYKDLYEYLAKAYNAIDKPGIEADDLVSIRARELEEEGMEFVVAHIDKDLDMIPGEHIDFRCRGYFMPPIEAELCFYTQLLVGDTADNIPGLKGIGPKKAEKLLAYVDTPEEMWDVVVDAYSRVEPEIREEDIINRGILLRLLENEGELWKPPT